MSETLDIFCHDCKTVIAARVTVFTATMVQNCHQHSKTIVYPTGSKAPKDESNATTFKS